MTTTRTISILIVRSLVMGAVVLVGNLNAGAAEPGTVHLRTIGDETYAVRLLFEDQFTDLNNWVVEGNGRVKTEDGQLIWDCAGEESAMGTIWCRELFSGPTIIEYDAVALEGKNNLNFIAYANHPPDGLLETTGERTGQYKEYHQFPNNIITYLSSDDVAEKTAGSSASRWRVRFRRNPGFNLLSETYISRKAKTSQKQKLTYVLDSDGSMSLYADGILAHHFVDSGPTLRTGYHGFRTWKSNVRYSNFKVYQIETDLRGSTEIPFRSHRIPYVDGGIKIDGRLDDPGWIDTPDLEPSLFTWRQAGKKQDTRIKMTWDDEYLYVAFRCQDANVTAVHTERDSSVYKDDCVELFASPDPARAKTYFNLEMNANAAYLDDLHPAGRKKLAAWNPEGIKVAVAINGTLNDDSDVDQGWTLELAFPFAATRGLMPNVPPKPGDEWRLNLNRLDQTPGRVLSMWSPIISKKISFHQPEFFGTVVFSK